MIRFSSLLALIAFAPALWAQAVTELPSTVSTTEESLRLGVDSLLLLVGSALVLLMQPGFALLEIGLVRAKNTMNVVMKNVLDLTGSAISFLLLGFTLMFGATVGGFVGMDSKWLLSFAPDSPIWSFLLFQTMFAATCCTIASGAMAERTRFLGYLVFSLLMAGLIYPVLGHWVWGSNAGGLVEGFGGTEGWLEKLGFHDFAGATTVHAVGGASALAGIIIVGPRLGKFSKEGNPRILAGHSLPFAALGVFLLWVGWFGFNGASMLHASPEIGRVVVSTVLASAAGALLSLVFFWIYHGTPSPIVMLNGILGGLVSITACADVVHPLLALAVGAGGGLLASAGQIFVEHKLKLDDVVGAVSVHLFPAIWGSICVGLFHVDGFNPRMVVIQFFGILIVSASALLTSMVLFKLIDLVIGLRASEEDQEIGLDFSEHSVNSYPDFHTSER